MKDMRKDEFERYWSNPKLPMFMEQKGDFWLGHRVNGGHVCNTLVRTFNKPPGQKVQRFILNTAADLKHFDTGVKYFFNDNGVIIEHKCAWAHFKHIHKVDNVRQIIVVMTVDLNNI